MIKHERMKNTLKRINFIHNYSYNTDKNPKKDVSNHIMNTIKRNKK